MSLWTPSSIDTTLWLDAADSSTITAPDGVSEWRDKSGNSRHVSQATTSNRPQLVTSPKDGILFGGDDYLTVASLLTLPLTIFVAATRGTTKGQFIKIGGASDGVAIGYGGTDHDTNGTNLIGLKELVNWLPTSVTVAVGSVVSAYYPSGTSASVFYQDGTAVTINSGSTSAPISPTSLIQVGGYSGRGLDGTIHELVIIAGTSDTDTRQLIEGYLAWKWGFESSLPSGHPYETEAPIAPEIGNIVAPLPTITGTATNPIFSVGSIVAPKASISGKVWNAGTGEVTAPISQILGTAANQVPAVGRITLRGRVSGTAYNPVVSVAGITARLPIISGRAVNQELVSGGVTARGRIWGKATNPKAFEPIRFRRCGS